MILTVVVEPPGAEQCMNAHRPKHRRRQPSSNTGDCWTKHNKTILWMGVYPDLVLPVSLNILLGRHQQVTCFEVPDSPNPNTM